MQRIDLDVAVCESVAEVLETMFFTTLNGYIERQQCAPPSLSARLRFRGAVSGAFGVEMPVETGRAIASSFLAQEAASITAVQIREVVCELANMVCGSVLSRLGGNSRFELSSPEIDAETKPEGRDASCAFELDEGSMAAWLRMEPTV